MKTSIVLGLGFGDEGKGLVTAALAAQAPESTLVVRFGGGHQVGHNVHYGSQKHEFSNFGSGSISGAITYWSKHCTLDPIGIRNEYRALEKLGVKPRLVIDPQAMVTTPLDIMKNRMLERNNQHGSVGVGFGQTIQRNEDGYKLQAMDLMFMPVLKMRLDGIIDYYKANVSEDKWMSDFYDAVRWLLDCQDIVIDDLDFRHFPLVVFEGHQGALLDKDYGFFPHVTRSNTTVRNALDIISSKRLNDPAKGDITTVTYVTRAYATRHGNGPMTGEGSPVELHNTSMEGNSYNEWQGEFRVAPIDFDMLRYAMRINRQQYKGKLEERLVITCTDQMPTEWPYRGLGMEHKTTAQIQDMFAEQLRFNPAHIVLSSSPNSQDLAPKLVW